MADVPFLLMKGIQKRFPGVLALDSVDFVCEQGEVHGLIGENGAGKSTLIKVLGGVLQPDAGEILVQGAPVKVTSPSRAASLGISVIHQELNLIEDLTVAQNIFLGHEPRRGMGVLDLQAMGASARDYLRVVGLDVDPQAKVRALSLEQKQLVEIAKALSFDARILVMDEPTAALNAEEVKHLLKLIRDLADRGCGVVFISHRLEEVFAVSHRITVLRDGKVVATRARDAIDPETAVRMMTGKGQVGARVTGIAPSGRPLLEVRGLTLPGAFYDVSFTINEGEIVGMVGLEGQGQREIPRAVFGDLRPTHGEVYLRGTRLHLTSPRDAIRAGIAFVPEERKAEGLCLSLDVRQNIALATLDSRQMAGFVRLSREASLIRSLVERLRIQLASPFQEVRNLSGGNQQKVVMAKWLCSRPAVLLFSEPTRGIDVGAKEEIYRLIRRQADEGSGVLIVSSDLMEVLRLCDRILVVHDGRIVKEMPAEGADREAIMTAQWGLEAAPTQGSSTPGLCHGGIT
ncbi:MAG: sugar ABC transporter ATP-binding protein [Firmicutes bacterium]|nr:sugar ABC transporter ATP-binding protein [Bacillota bacterium]